MSITSAIKEFALDIGFSRVGVTSADPFPEFVDAVTSRKDQYGFLLNRQRNPAVDAAHPREATPGAKSIISVAYGYMGHAFPENLLRYVGRAYLARCYLPQPHRIHGTRVKLLCDFVERLGCSVLPAGAFVPDRWVGARSGVSTFGRNNFAYVSGAGSFNILYSIIVDKELEYDTPTATVPCPPNCRLCMDACPAKAITAPNTLDPTRCLSFNAWITQDNYDRGPGVTSCIKPEIREVMGTRVHGCDICQEVCPRNKAVLQAPRPMDPFLEVLSADFSLENLLRMDEAFNQTRVQPIMYNYLTHKKYFQRNAAIAMGNVGDDAYVPLLGDALGSDPEAVVRGYAAWALGRIGGQQSKKRLEKAASKEADLFAADEIRLALEGLA